MQFLRFRRQLMEHAGEVQDETILHIWEQEKPGSAQKRHVSPEEFARIHAPDLNADFLSEE